jgi:hypothetical protein
MKKIGLDRHVKKKKDKGKRKDSINSEKGKRNA